MLRESSVVVPVSNEQQPRKSHEQKQRACANVPSKDWSARLGVRTEHKMKGAVPQSAVAFLEGGDKRWHSPPSVGELRQVIVPR